MVKSTETLVKDSQRGDSAAFTDLILRYERAAWLTAWKVLRDHHLASDAVQNAFIAAYKYLPQLRAPSTFGSWLMRIVHREAIRLSKQRDRAVSLDPIPELEENRRLSTDDETLFLAICELPEHEQLVVVLRYFNGLPLADIARDSGRPIGTVTKQLSRAIQRLRTILEAKVL
ncbi:MAG: sigma-70 family RNA polymerase sigma factor [Pirellulales bacterium]